MSRQRRAQADSIETIGYDEKGFQFSAWNCMTLEEFILTHPKVLQYYVRLPGTHVHINVKSTDDKRLNGIKQNLIDSLEYMGNTRVMVYLRTDVADQTIWGDQISLYDEIQQ